MLHCLVAISNPGATSWRLARYLLLLFPSQRSLRSDLNAAVISARANHPGADVTERVGRDVESVTNCTKDDCENASSNFYAESHAYYAVRPTRYYGTAIPSPKWGFQLQLTPVIPSLIHGFNPNRSRLFVPGAPCSVPRH